MPTNTPSDHPEQLIGSTIGNRFELQRYLGCGVLGDLYQAFDLSSNQVVAIRILSRDISDDPQTFPRLRETYRKACQLAHRNIVAFIGMGKEGDLWYLVSEFVDGQSLREMLASKKRAGKTFSPKSAYNAIAHACNALKYAQSTMNHGLIGGSSVLVNRAGRIKITDFGLPLAMSSPQLRRASDYHALAPERRDNPSHASPASDVYSLGVLLHELLVGTPPPQAELASSTGIAELDEVIRTCLDPIPKHRYPNAEALKVALQQALHLGDIDGESHAVETEQPRLPSRENTTLPSISRHSDPSVPNKASAKRDPVLPFAPRESNLSATSSMPHQTASATSARIEDLLGPIQGDDPSVWLVQREGMDYGPFPIVEIKQRLYKGEFAADSVMVDQDTGERLVVRRHPALQQFCGLLDAHLQKKRTEEAERLIEERKHKTKKFWWSISVTLFLVIAAIGGVIAYVMLTRKPETKVVYREKEGPSVDQLINKIQFQWKNEPADQAQQREKLQQRKKKPTAARGAKGSTADDVTELGDVTQAGGDELLSQQEIQTVMQKNMRGITSCILQEVQRTAGLKQVSIDFGVLGSGSVTNVKVNNAVEGPFFNCINNQMRRIKFPAYDGALTRASFSISL